METERCSGFSEMRDFLCRVEEIKEKDVEAERSSVFGFKKDFPCLVNVDLRGKRLPWGLELNKRRSWI